MEYCSNEKKEQVLDYYATRFGVGRDLFSSYTFYSGGRGRISIGPSVTLTSDVVVVGLPISRLGKGCKPTTSFFHQFGVFVTKNIVVLDKEQALTFLRGENVEIDVTQATDGFVLMKYKKSCLGCGLLREKTVLNQLPKTLRRGHWLL